MKKNIYLALSLCVFGLALLLTGCGEPEELVPTAGNKLTALSFLTSDLVDTKITVEESETEGVIKIDADVNGLKTTDMTKISVSASIPNNARVEPAFVGPVDLSQPYNFDVIGSDGAKQSYVIEARLSVVYQHRTLWKRTATELGFNNHNNGAVGFSGDYVVVHDRGGFFYANISDGERVGDISMEGIDWSTLNRTVPLHMATDDAGNIASCNFGVAEGDEIHMFWWEGVTGEPQLLFKYVLDIPGAQVGRKIYVRGDMTDHAFLYLAISNNNIFLQWEIKDGKVVSDAPRRVNYTLDYTMGVQAKIVPIEVAENSNYFLARYENGVGKVAITLMDGTTNTPIYESEHHIQDVYHQWLGGGHAFDYAQMDGAYYMFMIEQNGYNWMREIFDVRKVMLRPDKISSIMELIKYRPWNGWLDFPLDPNYLSNGNGTGEVKVRVSEDGKSALVAFLCTNGGVELWEIY
ncbi:protein of unknown function [Mariniphaga anaerophila]|uniref:Uncharacterized protein n=1 Tax=Mariniphaga anaerophila TaxID=1484053 RepID=A0A1M5AM06_9BACT|nr:DUF5018 domain-containing protein [Mariniphaga anaerophila]SHF31196.1 protein of unknown function [Mariniphaga anaerophila]